jgi:hypothetical protein
MRKAEFFRRPPYHETVWETGSEFSGKAGEFFILHSKAMSLTELKILAKTDLKIYITTMTCGFQAV